MTTVLETIQTAATRISDCRERGTQTARTRLMKTGEMVEQGLLPVGTILTIKDRPNSAATVVDGRYAQKLVTPDQAAA